MPIALSLHSPTQKPTSWPQVQMQPHQGWSVKADGHWSAVYRWPANMPEWFLPHAQRRWSYGWLCLIVIALHAGLYWWLSSNVSPKVKIAPEPLQVALIQREVKSANPSPELLPVVEKKTVKQPRQLTKQTPLPTQESPPLPVVERITESSTQASKFEASVSDHATPAEAPQAAAPAATPATVPTQAEPEEKEEPPKFGVAYLNNPAPAYPRLSKRAGEQGRVLMKVLVSVEGLPASVEVSKSSGYEQLDAAAMAAVKQWRFEPARKAGKALSAYVMVPLSFSLN